MNQFKFEAFKKEFPDVFENSFENSQPADFTSVKVRRIDESLLSLAPNNYSCVGSMGHTDEHIDIIIFCKDGVVLDDIIAGEEFRSNYAGDSGYCRAGESVLEYIYRTEVEAENIKYIVVDEGKNSSWSGCDEELYFNRVIYKPARNCNIEEVIKKALKDAESKVKEEINF